MNNNMPSPEEVYAAMVSGDAGLQKQQQAASQQLQNENSSVISKETLSSRVPDLNPIISEESKSSDNLTDRIKNLEKKISSTNQVSSFTPRMGTDLYKDDYGQITWYIKNESGMHISLGDAMGVVIKKGEVIDLLSRVSEDVIIKSKDFLARLRMSNGGLRRLTQEEYFNELQVIDEQTRKIQALEAAKYLNGKEGNSAPQYVRPLIESQLNKLDLYFDPNPELSAKGMEPLLFIKWIMDERFNVQEIDSMLGHPRVRANTDITSTLIRKRHEID